MSERLIQDDEGRTLYAIEVVPVAESPLRGGEHVVETVTQNVRDVGVAIADLCNDVMSSVRKGVSAAAPDELELTFGIVLGGEVSVPFVTKATSEGTFTVRAKWNKSPA